MKTNRFLWIPRVFTICYILFLSLFSLDVFSMEGSTIQKLGGFLVHNIPSFLLILILIVSWKKPLVGGIFYSLCGLASIFALKTYKNISTFLLISVLLVLTGGLYLLIYFQSGKDPKQQGSSKANQKQE